MAPPMVFHSDDANTPGVLGEGPTGVSGNNTLGIGNGVVGYSDAGHGVWGHSDKTGIGVLGEGIKAVGVMGKSHENAGVLGEGATGVYGRNITGTGNGVIGYSDDGRGVWGHSNKTGIGVLGEAIKAVAVMGRSQENAGVLGEGATGVYGRNITGTGNGIIGDSDDGRGVWGHGKTGVGVLGESAAGIGVRGKGGHLAAYFEGDVEVTGDLRLTNADCAEDFDMAATCTVEPGTVMVLDGDGALHESTLAYDRRVAGVLSGGGTYRPAIVLDKQAHPSGRRQPLALIGKVFCKVDADLGAIAVGDLLTTSATPGHAMVATDPLRGFGTIVGKALRPLKEGRGLIPILIALQ
jgi:hypothetical protein